MRYEVLAPWQIAVGSDRCPQLNPDPAESLIPDTCIRGKISTHASWENISTHVCWSVSISAIATSFTSSMIGVFKLPAT